MRILIVVMVLVGTVAALWTAVTTPVVQKSYRTGQVVACASAGTDWNMASVEDHPECLDIDQAEVEWVK